MGILVILWNILKVVVFIVLFIVVLILIIMALVLFSPICYNVTGSYVQCVDGKFDIKWILGAIHAYGLYDKGNLKFSLRLFGYCICGDDKKQKKKQQEIEYTQQDTVLSVRSKSEQQKEEVEQQELQQNKKETIANETVETVINAEKKEVQQNQNKKEKVKKEQTKQKHSRKNVSDIKTDSKQTKQNKKTKQSNKENKNKKIDKYYFIHMENKKELLQAIAAFLKRMLKGVSPKHCSLKATIGTGDPALTGYLLGIAGTAKMKFGKGLKITGDFTQKIIKDVFLDVKGKIFLSYLLYAVLRLLFVKPVYKTVMVLWKGCR